MKTIILTILAGVSIYFIGCGDDKKAPENDSSDKNIFNEKNITPYTAKPQTFTDVTPLTVVNNKGAYVTSQCYTKTVDEHNMTHNPCFTCHINSVEPNYIDDWDLQESYAFSDYTHINHWTNLFKDRTDAVSAITDKEILGYVRSDNYKDANNTLVLAKILQNVPDEWDFNHDGRWNGYTPDCYFEFDDEGFDTDPNGNLTGWRAFGYYPFLGTFWPTNGSTDDVLIRLPKVMQQESNGTPDRDVYKVNLAIVEALIKKRDIAIETVDEKLYGVDLNQNGFLDFADKVVYRWEKPSYDFQNKRLANFSMYYVGAAKQSQIENTLHMAPGLYPEYTEFLHTVRYIDLDNNNSVTMAPRMKELRYGKKISWNTYGQLSNGSQSEIKEKDAFPDRLRTITGNEETGLHTGLGWNYQGFIEDKDGYLRPQTYEETLFCIGCHSGLGAIADSTFVFQRKFDAETFQRGWYHWSQKGLKGVKEPKMSGERYEYETYLQANGAGDEFRDNIEVMEKFFDANGNLIEAEAQKIREDISYLLFPSQKRALQLNKAYRVIVEEQSFIYGRDAHVKPVVNVHREVVPESATDVNVIRK